MDTKKRGGKDGFNIAIKLLSQVKHEALFEHFSNLFSFSFFFPGKLIVLEKAKETLKLNFISL